MIIVTLTEQQLNETEVGASILQSNPFIHASTIELFDRVIPKLKGRTDLFLVGIDEAKLKSLCRYEDKNENQLFFPHIYGSINREAILWVCPLQIVHDQVVWPKEIAPYLDLS